MRKLKNSLVLVLAVCLGLMAGCASAQLPQTQEKKEQERKSNVETERKFLIELGNIPSNLENRGDKYELVQTYISFSPEIRVRSVDGRWFFLTMKTPVDGGLLSRVETEIEISEEEYLNFLTKQEGSTIYKTRYQFEEDGYLVALDVYSGELEGLAVAEVEFPAEEEAKEYMPPGWFGRDITEVKAYKNGSLAKNGRPEEQ